MCRIPMDMSSVQELMNLSLPRFAGLADGLCQIHPPWSIASDSLASPALSRLDTNGEEDSCCSVDQMSVSSACLNLDLFLSSSEDDSKDLAERSDLSIKLSCDSDEADTHVNSDQVLSDGDFLEESVPKDKRQFVPRGASPPGGQFMGAAQDDQQYDPPLPVVDLVTGRCKLGKVSRTISRTPLTMDLTVVCMTSAVVPPPGVSSDTVVPPATVANDEIDVGTSVPVVTAPAPVVEQPSSAVREGVHVVEPLQPLLPLSERSSSSSSPTLPWGAAEDLSPPFSPNCVQAGCSQDVPDEDSLFNVSPLSPRLLFRPSRGVSRLRLRGYYCRRRWTTSMIRFWVIRSHMRGVNIFRGQSLQCSCLCMRGRLVRTSGWILQYFRLCWLRGSPLCWRWGPRPLLLL